MLLFGHVLLFGSLRYVLYAVKSQLQRQRQCVQGRASPIVLIGAVGEERVLVPVAGAEGAAVVSRETVPRVSPEESLQTKTILVRRAADLQRTTHSSVVVSALRSQSVQTIVRILSQCVTD